MIVIKRRLIFWLLKAYLKKWGKIFAICFILGLIIFFILRSAFPYIIAAFTGVSKQTIGIAGTYSINNLPSQVVADVSEGLTKVGQDGKILPGLAQSWDISADGKTYTFHLKHNQFFNDGTMVTTKDINLRFSNVKATKLSDYTISYTLSDSYSPFLVTVSQPIFKSGDVGVGPYRIKKIQTNGSFLENITLTSSTQNPALKIYVFYPTQEALKIAFVMGEINSAENLSDISFLNSNLEKFPHTQIIKSTNYNELTALFYNTDDKNLSDKKLRDALSYSLPNTFSEGQRAITSIPPSSIYYNASLDRSQDLDHANLLLQASLGTDVSTYPTLTISTLQKYQDLAKEVASSWKKIGIHTKIEIVDSLPQVFQIYLGDFNLPNDPDQYTLWHSFQENNITGFKSTRIDKLLEDGRKTVDAQERIKIYQDFQKYLLDEQPASFLFFPYNFEVTRK